MPAPPRFDASQHHVLVLGDVILDEYVLGDCSRISPEAPVPIVRFSDLRAVPGGAANTAANVAALRGGATLIGVIGDDAAGRELQSACGAAGIRFFPLQDGRFTTRKVRVISQSQQLLRLDYERTDAIDADSEARTIDVFTRELAAADIVVISDYAKGLLTYDVCREVIRRAHESGKPVIIDPRPQHAAFYADCDFLTPNWKEAQGLLEQGDRACTAAAILETGLALTRKFRCNVMLTLGAQGIAYFGRDGELFTVPSASREVFDVSGAGDTVVATFALAMAAGCDPRQAIGLANCAAGIVVGKRGTATVDLDELLSEQRHHPRCVDKDQLGRLASVLKLEGKRVVAVVGALDPLDAGHLRTLKETRQRGDVLVVGINSDASVRRTLGMPIVNESLRAEALLELRCVDYVHVFDDAAEFLDTIDADFHVVAADGGLTPVGLATYRPPPGRVYPGDLSKSRAGA